MTKNEKIVIVASTAVALVVPTVAAIKAIKDRRKSTVVKTEDVINYDEATNTVLN
jgi:hypothetical protein